MSYVIQAIVQVLHKVSHTAQPPLNEAQGSHEHCKMPHHLLPYIHALSSNALKAHIGCIESAFCKCCCDLGCKRQSTKSSAEPTFFTFKGFVLLVLLFQYNEVYKKKLEIACIQNVGKNKQYTWHSSQVLKLDIGVKKSQNFEITVKPPKAESFSTMSNHS